MRPLGLFAVASVLLCFAWAELEMDFGPAWDVVAMVALALAPTLAVLALRRWWIGLLVGIVALAPAAGIAFGISLADMRPGERDFFGPVFDAIGDGFRDVYETDAPFDRLDHPEVAGIVLLGLYVSLALCGLLVACRRPLAAGLVLVLGVALPVTIAASYGAGNPLTMGTLVLAAVLLTLFLTRSDRRPLRGVAQAGVLGAVLVLVALGASTSGAIAKDAFVSWTRWDLYDQPKDPVGVRYVWSSNYRGIAFPSQETVVLRIKAPKKSLYWRATTLDEYTGVGWREDVEPAPVMRSGQGQVPVGDPLLPQDALDRKKWIRQDVTVVALSDTHLVAASQPVRWRPGAQAPVQYASNGAVLAPGGLRIGSSYTVWSYAPQVRAQTLVKLDAEYPASLDRYLEVVPDVVFPEFDAPDRDAAVESIFGARSFDVLLEQYRPLYEEAKRVVGETESPYIAAASLEAYFRSQGGFSYSEQPEQPLDATPPLVDFVLRTKEGYCQHYAGAMAVMLRLLGIPARVAVGFTSGSYDDRRKEWTVTDHDAHAWVEVYFPGQGWLPFDPTPGRGQLSAAYSTASAAFPTGAGPTALGVSADALSAILKQRLEGVDPGDRREAGDVPGEGASGVANGDEGGGIGVAGLVFIVLGALLAVVLAAKELRRRARFLSRDPRKVAAACRRDLVAFLADQRVEVDESVTLSELGAYVEKAYRVDARPFVRAATAARFATPEVAGEAATRARKELRALEKQLRRTLPATSRARGALSWRSLPV